jgi:exodeoxyribonuclease V alpha subunit
VYKRQVPESIVIKGTWHGAARGPTYTVTGTPVLDPKWGAQLKLDDQKNPPTIVQPSDRDGLIALLSAEDVAHLGPVRASAVVDKWGVAGAMRILSDDPARLAEIPGITPQRAQEAAESWAALNAAQVTPETLRALYRYGLTAWQVRRLVSTYGDEAHDIVRKDPYRIVEIDGIGFHRADAIAQRAGMQKDHPKRVRAGVLHVLEQLSEDGHTEAPADVVCALVVKKNVRADGGRRMTGLAIDVEEEQARRALASVVADGLVVEDGERVALVGLREAEGVVSGLLLDMAGTRGDR